jgi:hypothetical protein
MHISLTLIVLGLSYILVFCIKNFSNKKYKKNKKLLTFNSYNYNYLKPKKQLINKNLIYLFYLSDKNKF